MPVDREKRRFSARLYRLPFSSNSMVRRQDKVYGVKFVKIA